MGIIKTKIVNMIRGGMSSEEYIRSLKKGGATIGKGVVIFSPRTVTIDSTRPWLVEIGDYTKITAGVKILTHDYSLSVLRRTFGTWIGEGAVTKIGDNCFLGMNAIVLMGTQIGNNVIVGAGSVVHGIIPDNVVIAGNPAKIICTLEEHYNNRLERTKKEAINCAKRYRDCFGKNPSVKDLEGFKFLFLPRDKKKIEDLNISFTCNGDNPKEVEEMFYNTQPFWENFDMFLKDAGLL